MNVTFIARKELAAYLVSSAVSSAVNRIGASIKYSGRYSRRSTSRAFSLCVPITMRSGRMKSPMALPSRRNSGLDATSNSPSGRTSRMISSKRRPVPTGTVLLVTITA